MSEIIIFMWLAVIIDAFIGDPRITWHPVVLIGRLITWVEKCLRSEQDSAKIKKIKGAILVIFILLFTYVVIWQLLQLFSYIHPWLYYGVGALLLAFSIAPRSLAGSATEIYGLLLAGNIIEARKKVGWIVGRDTDKMNESAVCRATVETVAENTVDGVVSPLFYVLLGGVPLACLYRAVNTLDSMVGYKNDKYKDFGMVAARVDDVFNFIPARITGILTVIVALLLGYKWREAWAIMVRDASKHPSPNGGYAEASVAGALGIRLGGLNYYFGQSYFRAYMGDGDGDGVIQPQHILNTIKIMYGVTMLFLLLVTLFIRR